MADENTGTVVEALGGTPRDTKGEKLFGEGFPGKGSRSGKAWTLWIEKRIDEQRAAMDDRNLHSARHRNFRMGRQWISTRDRKSWRVIEGDQNKIRAVLDIIGPSLDFRLGIMTEQRPGFRTHPLGTGVAAKETAEAQQMTAEFHQNRLKGGQLLRGLKYNAQTDGVAFAHVFVDRNAGPTKRDVELVPSNDPRFEMLKSQGYEEVGGNLELPLNESGAKEEAGTEVRSFPTGEIGTRIVKAHEVFFDVEAMTVNGPYDRAKWCILRRVRDLGVARIETGKGDLTADPKATLQDPVLDALDLAGTSASTQGFTRGLPPYPTTRAGSRRQNPAVFDYLIYIAPAKEAGVEDGLWRRVMGGKVLAGTEELPGGKIPLARFSDGSTDTDILPIPVITQWINDQISINALWSTLLEHVRIFGTGRVLAPQGTVLKETYSNIVGSLLQYTGGGKPEFLSATSAGRDTWSQLQMAIDLLREKTGWTKFAVGQVTGSGSLSEVSGRALLGAKEMFERNFGNDIRASAEGMSELAVLWVDYSRWLYDDARMIPFLGRGDLAKKISGKDLGEETVVYVDDTTLMPVPFALKNQMLVDMVDRGWITLDEYKRRSPFADIRNVMMGDQPQWERAQWINTYLEENWEELAGVQDFAIRFSPGVGIPILWQDDPSVFKRALEEIIFDERKSLQLRDIAQERWGIYDQLGLTKQPPTDPATGQPGPPQPLAEPALLVVRGVPMHLGGQPPAIAPPAPAPGTVPGEEGAPVSGAPEIAGVAGPAVAAPGLGEFGEVERAAQTQEI